MNKFKVGDHIIRTKNPLGTNTEGLKGVITGLPVEDSTQYRVLVGTYSRGWLEEYMILDPDFLPETIPPPKFHKRSMFERID